MGIISVRDVWKIYGEGDAATYALRGVSLDIEQGDFVAIIGPSGSGKSTLMHIIGLLDTPTKGKVLLKGKDVSTLSDDERAIMRRKTVGFVFQQYNLSPSLNALENVELPMLFAGVPKREREKRAKELLEMVGLGHRLYHYPNQLSGGQQQRVAIARALANDPEIILGDEPTGNLDTKTGEKILKIFKDLNKRGKTIVIVTHDPEIAEEAEKIVKIRDGKIEGVIEK
ncbi:MAG: putative transport system ATP-binding protein [Candidatus Diapherotrites archaeon]|nr:putative transport system ATP-binding protein [Candidatus Diapherotrites archaeon]